MGWWGVTLKRLSATKTDLQSALDQIKGNDSGVCGTTAQNPTNTAQEEILLRAKLNTVSLWRKTCETWSLSQVLNGFLKKKGAFLPPSKMIGINLVGHMWADISGGGLVAEGCKELLMKSMGFSFNNHQQ